MTTPASPFDESYYMDGIRTGKSNYVNYRWIPELTIPMAKAAITTLGIKPGDSLLDVGCARGFFVKAMRGLGVDAWGYDISEWAIRNCDPEIATFVGISPELLLEDYDFIFLKDLCEHVDLPILRSMIDQLLLKTRRAMLAIVPLSFVDGGDYVRREDNQDATHLIRWPLSSWLDFFQSRAGSQFNVNGSWHLNGLKPTSFSHLKSCGFFTITRNEEDTPAATGCADQ